jgi:hypothetical protein
MWLNNYHDITRSLPLLTAVFGVSIHGTNRHPLLQGRDGVSVGFLLVPLDLSPPFPLLKGKESTVNFAVIIRRLMC